MKKKILFDLSVVSPISQCMPRCRTALLVFYILRATNLFLVKLHGTGAVDQIDLDDQFNNG